MPLAFYYTDGCKTRRAMNSRLWLQLLARRSRGRQSNQDGGFALVLALLVAFTVLVGWVALANRSSSSRLGAALQDENREARAVAESGLAIVIDELNRPANRMILAKGQMVGTSENSKLTSWNQPLDGTSSLVNPCINIGIADTANKIPPTALATTLGKGEKGSYIPLAGSADGDRLTRQFRLVRYELKNADRSTGADYDPDDVNLRPNPVDPITKANPFPKRGVGYIELTVEGQVLRNGKVVSTSRVTQEFQVVPKCCNRSFRGPGDTNRQEERSPDGFLPGIYGDDNRYCYEDFPQMILGTGNDQNRNDGGLFLVSSTPNLRNQGDPSQRPPRVLCYTTQASCGGSRLIDDVPVISSKVKTPNVPVLSTDGIPCDIDAIQCQIDGANKAESNGFSARAIELLDRTDDCTKDDTNCEKNGAKNNSATDKYSKDYIRVNGKNLEICNKFYDPKNTETAATNNKPDRSPKIVPGSCELLYDSSKPNSDKSNVCARQEIDGFVSYHCRISNIFVNDFDGKTEANALANNTLFIDTTGNPETKDPRINLYVNEAWAKTKLSPSQSSDIPLINTMKANGLSPLGFRSIYTVGGYNDGQIQQVNCGNRTSNDEACLTPADPDLSTRASIVSSCKRSHNKQTGNVDDLCQTQNRSNAVSAEVGDDGFMRGLFLYAPYSTITVFGDPTVNSGWDSQDLDQGRPQIAAAVWAHRLRFVNRTTEIYVPGTNAQFFGMETSKDDRYTPIASFDYVARGITRRSLFTIPQ